jgi:putative hydrolase of the HAD superfamily
MPAYRAVLFDFFGTLTRSVRRGPQHAAIARLLGCDPGALIAVLDQTFYARACGLFGSSEVALRWVSQQAGGRPDRDTLRAAAAARVEALRADTALRPDAVLALYAMRRLGLSTAVVSDCTYELPLFLPRLPVAPLLDACVYSVEIGRCKPEPEIYLAACDRLRVAPQQCLYVGDGGSQELTGAAELGMTAVRLDAPDLAGHLVFNPEVDWAGPSVASLSELIELVDRAPAAVA